MTDKVNGWPGSLSKIAAAVMWTAAIALAIAGSIDDTKLVMFWALLVALGASVVTNYIIGESVVRRDRIRVERMVDGLIARARERADSDLPRLRH